MRVLSVIHYPVFGGPTNMNAMLAPMLANHGIDLIAVVPAEPDNITERLTEAGMTIHRMQMSRLRATRNPLVQFRFLRAFLPGIRAFRKLISEVDADVIQVNGMENPQAAIAGRLEGIGVVGQFHGLGMPWPVRVAMSMFGRLFADALMVPGTNLVRYFPGLGSVGSRLTSWVPPVDPRVFDAKLFNGDSAKAELGIPRTARVVGTVGNVNPAKGYDSFLKTASLIKRRRPDTRFVIVGHVAASQQRLYSRLKRQMEILGLHLGSDLVITEATGDTARLLSSFDVYLQSSVAEGTSTSLLEAMSMGKAVVATNVGQTAEVIGNRGQGVLVEKNRPDQAAEQVLHILGDDKLRAAMGKLARETILEMDLLGECVRAHLYAYQLAIRRANLRTKSGRKPTQ